MDYCGNQLLLLYYHLVPFLSHAYHCSSLSRWKNPWLILNCCFLKPLNLVLWKENKAVFRDWDVISLAALANTAHSWLTSPELWSPPTRTVHHQCCVTPLSFTFVLVSFVPSKGLTLLKHTNNDPRRHFITFYILRRLTWFFFTDCEMKKVPPWWVYHMLNMQSWSTQKVYMALNWCVI